MKNLKPEFFKDFFIQTQILTAEEFDKIAKLCQFDIKMPERGSTETIITIRTKDVLPSEIYDKLVNHGKEGLTLNIESTIANSNNYSEISLYIDKWLAKNHSQDIRLRELLSKNNYKVNNGILSIKYLNRSDFDEIKNVEKELLLYLSKAHFSIDNIVFELDVATQNNLANAAKEREDALNAARRQEANRVIDKNKQIAAYYKVTGKFNKIGSISKEDVSNEAEIVVKLQGEITFAEKRQSKKNPDITIYEWNIYDHEDGAIKLKFIANNSPAQHWRGGKKFGHYVERMPVSYLDSFKLGDWVNVEGVLEKTSFDNFEVTCKVNKMVKAKTPDYLTPVDNAEKKRVELLIHSNMTAYDGLDSPTKIYDYVKSLGHKAVGIIDRENVQAIPEIHSVVNTCDIKPLYGCEFEVIEKKIPIVVNPVNKPILTSEYVIFDIETTGLYPETEDLLEFGAIRWKNGEIAERIDFFAKPTKELTNVAINMSHITPDMVADAISQKEALKKIKQWIGDSVLIAHNGIRFDLMFLNKLCEKYNIEPITNCLIDTLEISHAINKDFVKHNLGFLTNKLKADYNELEAHRADKDSEYLLKVWQYFMKKLTTDWNIESIDQINDKLQTASLRANRHGYFIDVYVKTQPGIKALYKLVSLSLTERLFQRDDDDPVPHLSNGVPKLYFEDLLQYRQDLVVCPHPYDGEIWESALCDPIEKFKNKICKYDYVFVAPAKNIGHLVAQEKITKRDINKVLINIIKTTKSLGKKVCAVSDAYYTKADEKRIHEIYVYTKQLGGKRHWLYRHDGTTFIPDLHYLTTQEMLDEFTFLKDENLEKEIVIDNTNEFADRIEKVAALTKTPHYPKWADAAKKLVDKVWFNAKRIYGDPIPDKIVQRINAELKGISSKGYETIYWICHKLVKKANEDGYLVGSRGSVGSSIIAFLAEVSEVNPLPPHYVCPDCKYYEEYSDDTIDGFDLPPKKCPRCGKELIRDGHNIPFSSFIGINADKTPDIDLNFSGEYQAKAHNFIRDMFGAKHAYRAGTIATTAEKMAYGYVKSYFEQLEQLGKLDFTPSEPLIAALAAKAVGVKRTTGQHPGGIVVTPTNEEVTEITPYSYPSNDKTKGWFTTHFEYHPIEENLLKFDILGHDEPTILKHLKDATGVNPITIPNHDDKVLELFIDSKGLGIQDSKYNLDKIATIALPEFGTEVTRRIVKETKPNCVADLIRISGLSHGKGVWQGNAQDLVKQGIQLNQVVGCREDIIDTLVRYGVDPIAVFDMTEKIRKNKGLKPEYEKMLIEKNVPKWYIGSLKKITYLFPKAHATAYVLDAIRTAWYKVYYPAQFYAVWFSARSDVFDIETVVKGPAETEAVMKKYIDIKKDRKSQEKLSTKQEDLIPIFEVCLEMFARGIKLLNIDINKSQATEFIGDSKENTILPPFSSIDGLGSEVAKSIVEARKQSPFVSIADLQERTRLSTTLIGKLKAMHVLDDLPEDDQIRLF